MPDDKDQRTEQATPKKKKDERKKGNVFSSKDVVNLATVLVAFYTVRFMFPTIVDRLSSVIYSVSDMAVSTTSITVTTAMQLFWEITVAFVIIVFPIALLTSFSAIVATGWQTKFLFSGEVLKPKFSRMNPIEGFKKMFAMRSAVEVLKSTIKVVVILVFIYRFFINSIVDLTKTLQMDVTTSVSMILSAVMSMVNSILIAFLAMAVLDYLYQRYDYEKNLRMTKHEVKEEYKQLEGDPQIKGKIKEKQRAFAQSRMMQAVPGADVVIRNPTHYAVALRYDINRDNAPIVVAKGVDHLALRIVQVAEANDVYVTEEPELTRAIYAVADIDQEIPFDFYKAVAEVLAYVYKIKEKEVH